MERLTKNKVNGETEHIQIGSSDSQPSSGTTIHKFRKFLVHSKAMRNKKPNLEDDSDAKLKNSLSEDEFDRKSSKSFLRQSFHSLRNSFRAKCGHKFHRSLTTKRRNTKDNNNNDDYNNNKLKTNWNSTAVNNSDDSDHCNHNSIKRSNNCLCDKKHFLSTKCGVDPR